MELIRVILLPTTGRRGLNAADNLSKSFLEGKFFLKSNWSRHRLHVLIQGSVVSNTCPAANRAAQTSGQEILLSLPVFELDPAASFTMVNSFSPLPNLGVIDAGKVVSGSEHHPASVGLKRKPQH